MTICTISIGLYSKSVYTCWTWYIYFIWNTFLFECVGVDPHAPSASAAPRSVSPAIGSLVLWKSIRLIFQMRVLYSGLKLFFCLFPQRHCETVLWIPWEWFIICEYYAHCSSYFLTNPSISLGAFQLSLGTAYALWCVIKWDGDI